jgi:hypothetical protein
MLLKLTDHNQKEAGWEITLTCPGTLDASGVGAYRRQIETLRSIVQRELDEDVRHLTVSFLISPLTIFSDSSGRRGDTHLDGQARRSNG